MNRSNRSFNEVEMGCVVELDGGTRVVARLFATRVDDAVFAPNRGVEGPLRTLNERSEVKSCPEGARFAVIRAKYSKGGEWAADGTPWPR